MIAGLLLASIINTLEIIKLLRVNIFMPVTKFPHLTMWLFCKKVILDLWLVQGAFQRNQWQELGILR